ncbi:hypothetical protein [Cytobacillus purgationiresistens]|uniref:Uncharacterized protein n=1 Tax=Cytobacillus purgationiresistens TaxID=863449 RepID=A0ABU0AFC1_9BACI|nr:hypothetical protein [Cytobacillus purgationiresistens]MDQ0269948.1 hypothetical protein [Cytobacillus purgationiresistens]
MKLWEFTQKRVKVTFKDGEILKGFVRDYIDQEDTDFDYDELSFIPDGQEEITISELEINTIEIIE